MRVAGTLSEDLEKARNQEERQVVQVVRLDSADPFDALVEREQRWIGLGVQQSLLEAISSLVRFLKRRPRGLLVGPKVLEIKGLFRGRGCRS